MNICAVMFYPRFSVLSLYSSIQIPAIHNSFHTDRLHLGTEEQPKESQDHISLYATELTDMFVTISVVHIKRFHFFF